MRVRAADFEDLPAVHVIYTHHVKTSLGTFETEPPELSEFQARYVAVIQAGFPYLIAEANGQVRGYAYAAQFRPRAAYRETVEDSVYVAPDAIGRGIGQALLTELIQRCARLGMKQMLAFIGDSHNAASIGAHRACGFVDVGLLTAVGRKFERHVDVVIMQRTLA